MRTTSHLVLSFLLIALTTLVVLVYSNTKGQDSFKTTAAYNEFVLTFKVWQDMYVKRKRGTMGYQEVLQWERVQKAWEKFDKTVMEEYKQ